MTDILEIVERVITSGSKGIDPIDGFKISGRPAKHAAVPDYLKRKRRGRPSRAERWIESVPHFEEGWYTNQALAGEALGAGYNTIQTTSTATGKTDPHIAHTLHVLEQSRKNRVLFVFTTKALLVDQYGKMAAALRAIGESEDQIGIINGDVDHGQARFDILRKSRILFATPDINFTFTETNLDNPDVRNFVRDLQFIVYEEGHLYAGILGSMAPHSFRRLEFARDVLRGVHTEGPTVDRLQIAAASASLRDAAGFMERLTGQPFVEIG